MVHYRVWGHNGPGYPTSPPPHASACRLPAGGRSRQTREVVGRWGPGPLRARIRHWLLPRCKRQMQDAQHKKATQGGGKGGGNKTKPNRRPTKTATEQKTRERESKNRRKTRTHKPFGNTEEETPNRTTETPENTRGGKATPCTGSRC